MHLAPRTPAPAAGVPCRSVGRLRRRARRLAANAVDQVRGGHRRPLHPDGSRPLRQGHQHLGVHVELGGVVLERVQLAEGQRVHRPRRLVVPVCE
eukprot:scaffold282301_cov35-Prasinocladus_malaysianus.AAC.1